MMQSGCGSGEVAVELASGHFQPSLAMTQSGCRHYPGWILEVLSAARCAAISPCWRFRSLVIFSEIRAPTDSSPITQRFETLAQEGLRGAGKNGCMHLGWRMFPFSSWSVALRSLIGARCAQPLAKKRSPKIGNLARPLRAANA